MGGEGSEVHVLGISRSQLQGSRVPVHGVQGPGEVQNPGGEQDGECRQDLGRIQGLECRVQVGCRVCDARSGWGAGFQDAGSWGAGSG